MRLLVLALTISKDPMGKPAGGFLLRLHAAHFKVVDQPKSSSQGGSHTVVHHNIQNDTHQQTAMVSSKPANDWKRKPMAQEPEAIVSTGSRSDVHQSDCKARRVSTDASTFTATSHKKSEAAIHVQRNPKLTQEYMRKVFPDLYHSDCAKVTAALDPL
jgi:hypothetical protein